MSGFIALLNTDGAPANAALLQTLTDTLAFRGPDGLQTWHAGAIGLGHAMLRTTDDAAREQQPCSLDGHVWITADARIDDRDTLRRALSIAGRADASSATDPQLILHAYHAWGDACVLHLLGDFSFVIWDALRQRLFCARDHFGVKPFYYAHSGSVVALSNTLNTLRKHPAVSSTLNDLAIADFLLFGGNQEPDTTSFADIQRLPAAHTLIVEDGALRVQRYWTLPIEDTLRYKRDEEYVEHFTALFEQAVSDRLRTNHVAVLMSGGLDSTSIAAVARDLLRQQYPDYDLQAFSFAYDDDIPDTERYWSGLAATHLDIAIHYTVMDGYKPYDKWETYIGRMPEPIDEPQSASDVDHYSRAAGYSRVALGGNGGDPGLYPAQSYFPHLVSEGQMGQALHDVVNFSRTHRRPPPLYIGTWLRTKLGRQKEWQPPYKPWLNNDFAKRLHLRERWACINQPLPSTHPARPEAYNTLVVPFWSNFFELQESGSTGIPLEVRYPFFDLRLMRYMLRLPAVPWCVGKEVLRRAMLGKLPESVRLRPKTPLAGYPLYLKLMQGVIELQPNLMHDPQCKTYIEPEVWAHTLNTVATLEPYETEQVTRAMSLAYWIHCLQTKQPSNSLV